MAKAKEKNIVLNGKFSFGVVAWLLIQTAASVWWASDITTTTKMTQFNVQEQKAEIREIKNEVGNLKIQLAAYDVRNNAT